MAKRKSSPVASEILSTAEAAKLLKLAPRTVRQHADAGNLPSQLVGGNRIFRREDVLAFRPAPRGRRWPKKAPA